MSRSRQGVRVLLAGLVAASAAAVGAGVPAASAAVVSRAAASPRADLGELDQTSVSCPAVRWCAVAGNNYVGTGNGYTWSWANLPVDQLNPSPGIDGRVVTITDISCPAIGWCGGVGLYNGADGNSYPFLVSLNGGTWSVVSPPTAGLVPAASSEYPDATATLRLSRISCPTAGACVAVGYYSPTLDANGDVRGLIETLTDGSWTATTTPISGLQAPGDPAQWTSSLDDITCTSSQSCVAVGSYKGTSGVMRGLLERFGAGRWTPAAGPPSALPSTFWSVSCASATYCVATGAAFDGPYVTNLIATFARGAWTSKAVPLTGLSPAATGSESGVGAVTCSVAVCVAVGSYLDASGNQHPLVEQHDRDGGAWHAVTVDDTSLVGTPLGPYDVHLDTLSCPAPGSCRAAGSYFSYLPSVEGPVIMTLSHGRWTLGSVAAGPSQGIAHLSCPAIDWCVGVGISFAFGFEQLTVQRFSGGEWALVTQPPD